MREAGAEVAAHEQAAVGALMAMLEHFSYGFTSRRIVVDDAVVLDTLTTIVHRGFFSARGAVSRRPR